MVRWPSHWYSPGIMGPYSFVPFMECYHGILSMDHEIHGALEINNKKIDFTGGRISESMKASLDVKLIRKKNGEIIFSDTGHHAGLEVAGLIGEIMIG